VAAANSLSPVTVSFLNSLYRVPSNQGSGALSQSVFATNNEYFSPEDLNTFQTTYKQHVQAAVAVNGHSASSSQVSGRMSERCVTVDNLTLPSMLFHFVRRAARLASSAGATATSAAWRATWTFR